MSASSTVGITYTINTTYLALADSIKVEIDLSKDDICRFQRWYGNYSALYVGSSNKLKGADDGIYIGTDGISCGTGVCLTPDGHGSFTEVTARNIGDLNDLATTDKTSLVAAINELYSLLQ